MKVEVTVEVTLNLELVKITVHKKTTTETPKKRKPKRRSTKKA
ncbi:MAG: hypothetical protein PUI29_01130 [Aeromonadales bacterium]|nr:hypothetical protein [Aeromonadales bacterium]MDY2891640.1 hypothetical protein [Succinivibrio sp.]